MDQTITGASLVSCFGEPRITGWKCVLFFTLTTILYVDLAFCIRYEWNDLMKLLFSLKEMTFTVFCTGGYFAHLNMSTVEHEYIFKYLKYVDEPHHSAKKRKIINDMNIFIKWLSSFSTRAFRFIFFVAAGLPLIHIIITLAKAHFTGREIEKMPSVMHIYVPQRFRTVHGYLLAHTAAFVWYAIVLYMWSIVFKIFVIGMGCLCTEMKILFESVNEIDDLPLTEEISSLTASKPFDETHYIQELVLKKKFNSVIEHHQEITKSMKTINRMFQSTMILFLNVYCLQLCSYLIFVMKLEDINQRIKFAILYLFALYLQYQYASCSQRIKDRIQRPHPGFNLYIPNTFFTLQKGETFGEKLYECCWLDKPQWMKKMLLIMKCMADQPLVIKPYGLYVVDRRFMANIFKATYTYLNVVNEFMN